MPIHCPIEIRRISQDEFKLIANQVMKHVFHIHKEFGCLFDDLIYKQELKSRMNDVAVEVPVTISHGTFKKVYFLDVLVGGCGLFEFKATSQITRRHRGQTLNYLLLADLAHAKLVNVRPSRVEHEFVNCTTRLCELRNPEIIDRDWQSTIDGATQLRKLTEALVADWGCGLETALYMEAITHFLGGEVAVVQPIPVLGSKGNDSTQLFHCVAPKVAFKISAIGSGLGDLETQYRKLIQWTDLQAIHWINMTQQQLIFRTMTKS